jgi:hypothetical protein
MEQKSNSPRTAGPSTGRQSCNLFDVLFLKWRFADFILASRLFMHFKFCEWVFHFRE